MQNNINWITTKQYKALQWRATGKANAHLSWSPNYCCRRKRQCMGAVLAFRKNFHISGHSCVLFRTSTLETTILYAAEECRLRTNEVSRADWTDSTPWAADRYHVRWRCAFAKRRRDSNIHHWTITFDSIKSVSLRVTCGKGYTCGKKAAEIHSKLTPNYSYGVPES